MTGRLRELLAGRKPLVVLLGGLFACFVTVALAGAWFLLHLQAVTAAQQEIRAENIGLRSGLEINLAAEDKNIRPVPNCNQVDNWSAFPENSLRVERVYAFYCDGTTYLMLPKLEAR